MAYTLKYTSTFRQLKGYSTSGEWQIKIYKFPYNGLSTEFKTVADSIKLIRSGGVRDTVLTTSLKFDIFNETEQSYIEFATAGWGDYKIELIKDPNGTPEIEYTGYNQTEIYTESLETLPSPISLTFVDGLNHLKYIRWDNSGTLYTGQKSVIEVLRLALNVLPNQFTIREFVNVYDDSMLQTTTDSLLNQLYVDVEVFLDVTEVEGTPTIDDAFLCYRVIEEILKPLNCQIFKEGDMWIIIRRQEYKDTTMYYREFIPRLGTESTIMIDATGNITTNERDVTNANLIATDIIMPAATAEREISLPINKIQLTHLLNRPDIRNADILRNGHWKNINASASGNGFPSLWVGGGTDTVENVGGVVTESIDNENYIAFDESSPINGSNFVNNYVEFTRVGVQTATSDSMQFNFSVVIRGSRANIASVYTNQYEAYIENNIHLIFPVEIKIGGYYLTDDTSIANDNLHTFVATPPPTVATFHKTGLGSDAASGVSFIKKIDFDQILSFPQNGVYDIRVRIYQPYADYSIFSSALTLDYDRLGGYNLFYLPLGANVVDQQIFYAQINEDEIFEEINVILGDSPSTINQGGFKLLDTSNTDLWNRRGVVENIPILTILINSLRDDYGDYGEIIKGQLIGEFDAFNTIKIVTGTITRRYIIENYSYSVESNTWDLSLFLIYTSTDPIVVTGGTVTPAVSAVQRVLDTGTPIPQSRVVVSATTIMGSSSGSRLSSTNINNF